MKHEFSGAITAEMTTLVDARGRTKQFAIIPCPAKACRGQHSLIVCLRGLEPLHMSQFEALDLVDQLRTGPQNAKLKPSPYQSGRFFAVTQCAAGRYSVAYDLEGQCDLIVAGGPIENVPKGMSALLIPSQRQLLADLIHRELAITTGDLAGTAAAQA